MSHVSRMIPAFCLEEELAAHSASHTLPGQRGRAAAAFFQLCAQRSFPSSAPTWQICLSKSEPRSVGLTVTVSKAQSCSHANQCQVPHPSVSAGGVTLQKFRGWEVPPPHLSSALHQTYLHSHLTQHTSQHAAKLFTGAEQNLHELWALRTYRKVLLPSNCSENYIKTNFLQNTQSLCPQRGLFLHCVSNSTFCSHKFTIYIFSNRSKIFSYAKPPQSVFA